jgi:class 3 adenylate cyclase
VQQAAKQRRSFLHTLIPPNVLARLASHSTSNMGCLATDIPECIIMFCYMSTRQEHANDTDAEDFRRLQSSKDANDTDTEDFSQLHAVCLDFDDAVRMSGLYKYQHVGSWYIVTCPKAAAPFDVGTDSNSSNKTTPQQRPPALQYATQMAELALRLMSIARLHSLELQVGIHTGPAAGAVIGSLRAFYCVYGPAVNTASRLCKFAKSGQICCSQGVVSALESEHAACKRDAGRGGTTRHRVRVDACGSVCMKGLERMDVFSIPAIPLRCSVYARRNSSESEQPGVIRRPSVVAESFNVDAFRMSHASVQKACRRESETSSASDVSLAEHQSMLESHDSESHESHDSQQNPFMALLKSQDLSAESLEILKESMPSNFESIKRSEEQHKKDIAQNLQRRVGAGIAMHLFGVIFQRNLILYPEFPYNFEVLNAELKEAFQSVAELLEQQLYLQCALCLGLALAIIKGPLLRMQIVSIMHGLVRLWWLHFSLHLSTIWPVKQYTLVFPVLYSTLQLLIIQDKDKYVYMCALLLHLTMYIIMLYPVRDMVAPVFILRLIATTISTVLLHIWHDKASQQRWRLHRVFEYEMRRFEYILNDLLPSTSDQNASAEASAGDHDIGYLKAKLVYDNFLHDSSLPLHLERDAIVLQLDLCSFTEFSRKISPMELAETLHQLFSRFDTTVRSLNLFKMDTVGDAYIVAAWLTSEKSSTALKATHEADSPRQNTEYMTHARKSCHSVLWLAGMMLNALDSHRTKEGHQTTARIGVAVGKVVVGFLGWMQPRIHIRGYGMRKAEKLEQQGNPGMVHVCDSFLNILSGGRISDNSTSPDTFMEDPPKHASFGEGTRKRREERSTSNMQGTKAPAPDLAPHSTQGSGQRTGSLDLLGGPAGPHQQKISLSRLDLDLQGWSIVETRRNCQPEDDDEPALGPNTNKGSGVVSTSFILQRPRTSDWE